MKELSCYSDFPMPGDFPNYLPHSKFLEYLRMYADYFQLEQYIRFETEVVSVEQELDGGGRWSVTTRKTADHRESGTTEVFDAVMVCVGINSYINMPTFEGQDEFKGQLVHSTKYRQVRRCIYIAECTLAAAVDMRFHWLLSICAIVC